MNSIKRFISGFDLFPAHPNLRARRQSQVTNFFGGVFSLVVFGIFVYVFIDSIIRTVKLEKIDAKQILQMNRPLSERIGNITLAFGLQWNSLVYKRKIFELRAFLASPSMNFRPLQVFPCTRQHWKQLSDQKYKNLNLDQHMCIQREGVQIYGQNGAQDADLLFLNISICDNATSPITCATPAQINQVFAQQMIYGRFMACSLVVLDTALNPTNQNPISYTVYEKTLWLLFNQQQQLMAQLYLGTYQVQTDTSFLPFVTQQTIKGHFVSEAVLTTLVNLNSNPVLIEVYLFASPVNKVIDRRYGKFDEVLSYVGGLFGIIISFLAFFMISFNQYKYQLRVSEGAFAFDNSHLAKEEDFHFGKYLKYVAYDWIKTLLRYQPDWQDCQAIQKARQEACQQIDVKHLLQRISHLEQVIKICLDKQSDTAVYLAQLNSINDVKRRRDIFQYYDKFSKGTNGITITTLHQVDAMFNLANNLNKVHDSSLVSNSFNQIGKLQQNSSQNNQMTSLELMESSINKFSQRYCTQFLDFNEQVDQKTQSIEQQLAKAFFSINEQTRMMIIKKIPLGILIRMQKFNKSELNKSNFQSIVTQKQIGNLNPVKVGKFHQKKFNLIAALDRPVQLNFKLIFIFIIYIFHILYIITILVVVGYFIIFYFSTLTFLSIDFTYFNESSSLFFLKISAIWITILHFQYVQSHFLQFLIIFKQSLTVI